MHNNPLQPNRLLERVRSGKVEHLYIIGNHATPRIVDFVAGSGYFHSLWFDLEHFDIPTDRLATLNLVARAHPVTTIARLSACDYQSVQRTLETGIGGLMCAMVENAEQAATIVNWAKFNNPAPTQKETIGQRGWNGGGIDARYGNIPVPEYIAYQNRETFILCQIETQKGLAKADAIAAVPGVDGIFFGPGDYAHRIGLAGQIDHEEIYTAMKQVSNACRKHSKFWGTLGIGRENYMKVRELGAQVICPGGDVRTLNLGLKELASSLKNIPEATETKQTATLATNAS